MKTYTVEVKKIEMYSVPVEAESEEEAIDEAFSILEHEAGEAKFHNDSDAEAEAIEE